MPKITGYKWGSTEFFNSIENCSKFPEDDIDPIEQAELQAEQDEAKLWGL